jgi:hypothetical protein
MTPQVCFFLSIAFSLVAWSMVAKHYIWPRLRSLQRRDALRPLLVLHAFRFEGLAFLVSGVVSPDLPTAFRRLRRSRSGDTRVAVPGVAVEWRGCCHCLGV